jgi:PTS system cellobiose-specific IIA component
MEEIIFQLITYSGEAKSFCFEAIQMAKSGEIETAKEHIGKASEKLLVAHRFQTQLIQKEAGGESVPVSLLLIHAQDHLMNAIMLKDLAGEIIELYSRLKA